MQNSQGNSFTGVYFLRKLQHACKLSEIFKSDFFAGHLLRANSECSLCYDFLEGKALFQKQKNTANQKVTGVHP